MNASSGLQALEEGQVVNGKWKSERVDALVRLALDTKLQNID
jgi:hypothetical protein